MAGSPKKKIKPSRIQPSRQVKKISEPQGQQDIKAYHPKHIDDQGKSSLIMQKSDDKENTDLEKKMITKDVRITDLTPGSPEPNYPSTAYTPENHTKVGELCKIGNYSLFKPFTPVGGKQNRGRLELPDVSVKTKLPKLKAKHAEPIEFIATLDSMLLRAGNPRLQSQKTIMKGSCSDVFRAHGILITSQEGRYYHWAHLIGYFLGGVHEPTNLIPSTAAANYNTLEAIELYIQKELLSKKTNQIKISVTPQYNGESNIPDVLTYTLDWTIKSGPRSETFYIRPKSYQRITKTQHESIDILREEAENSQRTQSVI